MIDLDNMAAYCHSLNYPFRPDAILGYIANRGDNCVKAVCYGCIKHFHFQNESEILSELENNDILYKESSGKKNSADLALALDALGDYSKYERLYLVSSDRDFQPLFSALKKKKKEVVLIRMFNMPTLGEDIEETDYPSILGIDTPIGVDAKSLAYKNKMESILKIKFPSPEELSVIMTKVIENYTPGIPFLTLVKAVKTRAAFRILKTTLLGRGFRVEGKNSLISELKTINGLRTAFYRQCYFLLKKHDDAHHIEQDALNKAFGLRNEFFDIETKKLNIIEGGCYASK